MFSRAYIYGDKVEQEIAEGCRRLIKNVIICWNYFYLAQKIAEEHDAARRGHGPCRPDRGGAAPAGRGPAGIRGKRAG